MICNRCGAQNHADAGQCVICGAGLSAATPTADARPAPARTDHRPPPALAAAAATEVAGEINSYLVPAILSTVFCCWPTGIVAIVFAAQVSSKLATGDTAGARRASRLARTWSWVSLGLGLGTLVVGFLLALVGAAASM